MSAVTEGLLRCKFNLERRVKPFSLSRALLKVIHPSIKHSFEIIGNGDGINRTIELFQQRLSNLYRYCDVFGLYVTNNGFRTR
jgi:hypothetical protein